MTRIAAALLFSSFAAWCSQQPDTQTIVRRSAAANEADWNAAPRYDYFERDKEAAGTKVYRVTMIEGTPYQEVVEIDGEPLSPEARQREQRRLREETARRSAETASERSKRIAKYREDRNRLHLLEREMVNAFDFKLVGEKQLEPYDAYVLQALPKPGYKAPNKEAKVLAGMKGMLWIDKETWQWVRVTAEVEHAVSIGGFLARVQPGTRFELEKMPVGNGIWLPRHLSMSSDATILFLFHRREQEDVTWFNYRERDPFK